VEKDSRGGLTKVVIRVLLIVDALITTQFKLLL